MLTSAPFVAAAKPLRSSATARSIALAMARGVVHLVCLLTSHSCGWTAANGSWTIERTKGPLPVVEAQAQGWDAAASAGTPAAKADLDAAHHQLLQQA